MRSLRHVHRAKSASDKVCRVAGAAIVIRKRRNMGCRECRRRQWILDRMTGKSQRDVGGPTVALGATICDTGMHGGVGCEHIIAGSSDMANRASRIVRIRHVLRW